MNWKESSLIGGDRRGLGVRSGCFYAATSRLAGYVVIATVTAVTGSYRKK